MKLIAAYQKLKQLEPTFLTQEATAVLDVSPNHAASILSRLAKHNTIIRLTQGRWSYSKEIDPLLLPTILTYPMTAYISLYTALYYHGLIDQIPSTVFAISNGKTKSIQTPLATVSIHHIHPTLFTGYDHYGKSLIMMACPEKALFDTLYLSPTKSLLFKSLTEVELPKDFSQKKFTLWLNRVQNRSRQTIITQAFENIVRYNR